MNYLESDIEQLRMVVEPRFVEAPEFCMNVGREIGRDAKMKLFTPNLFTENANYKVFHQVKVSTGIRERIQGHTVSKKDIEQLWRMGVWMKGIEIFSETNIFAEFFLCPADSILAAALAIYQGAYGAGIQVGNDECGDPLQLSAIDLVADLVEVYPRLSIREVCESVQSARYESWDNAEEESIVIRSPRLSEQQYYAQTIESDGRMVREHLGCLRELGISMDAYRRVMFEPLHIDRNQILDFGEYYGTYSVLVDEILHLRGEPIDTIITHVVDMWRVDPKIVRKWLRDLGIRLRH